MITRNSKDDEISLYLQVLHSLHYLMVTVCEKIDKYMYISFINFYCTYSLCIKPLEGLYPKIEKCNKLNIIIIEKRKVCCTCELLKSHWICIPFHQRTYFLFIVSINKCRANKISCMQCKVVWVQHVMKTAWRFTRLCQCKQTGEKGQKMLNTVKKFILRNERKQQIKLTIWKWHQ